jgi:excisionase family DNA binding protein
MHTSFRITTRPASPVRATGYLTCAEAGALLWRKPAPIHDAIRRGELRAFQPGGEGAWLIRPEDLEAWVEASGRGTCGGTLSERLARA